MNDSSSSDSREHPAQMFVAGQIFGQLEIIRLLGVGGMGQVYEVHHRTLGTRYALKLINPEVLHEFGDDMLGFFRKEARVMAQLQHPGIVRVDDYGEEGGMVWIRQELIEGVETDDGENLVTLDDYIKFNGGQLSEEEVYHCMFQFLDALDHAHAKGCVHRDLKPGNILLTPDGMKITDFGLVQVARGDAEVTAFQSMIQSQSDSASRTAVENSIVGTIEYMSPEQKRGQADARSDLYSVALIAFRLLTGQRRPTFDKPSDLVDGLHPGWDAWFIKALAEEPDNRFQGAREMSEALPDPTEVVERSAIMSAPASQQVRRVNPYKKRTKKPAAEPERAPARKHSPQPKPKPARGGWYIFAGILLLGILGGAIWQLLPETITPGKPWTVPTGSIEMIWCRPGTFMMGSEDDKTQHQVTLTKGFYLGKYEVTKAQWDVIMGTSSSQNGNELPVGAVPWSRAMMFCQRLTEREKDAGRLPLGWSYKLPTEAQWEYACRAGTTTRYSFGNTISGEQANFNKIEGKITVVGKYPANPWGFHDMHGNVAEWVSDRQGSFSLGDRTDPTGPPNGSTRVFRGGSWQDVGNSLRAAFRPPAPSGKKIINRGFRLSLQQSPGKEDKVPTPGRLQPVPSTVEGRGGDKEDKVPAFGKPWTLPTASIEMIWCKKGTFQMGKKGDKRPHHREHTVKLTRGFWLGKHEVTRGQWKKVMGNLPGEVGGGDHLPVVRVSWKDAEKFCEKLNDMENSGGHLLENHVYQLPTEAQWEYACRAGTTTKYSFGDAIEPKDANYKSSSVQGKLEAVGKYASNPWGFHDMHGNAAEWVMDWYAPYPNKSLLTDPVTLNPKSGAERVLRGGGVYWDPSQLMSAHRQKQLEDNGKAGVGFRISLQSKRKN